MKRHLGNRPKGYGKVGQGKCVVCQDFHEWFEGFEKELTRESRQWRTDRSHSWNYARRQILKEILGETE